MIDIEQALIAYLSKALGVQVFAEAPKDRPKEFITVERLGGSSENYVIDYPMVAIQCWDKSRSKASAFAYEADKALQDITAHNRAVAFAKRNSMYNFPDPDSKQPRYQLVYDFVTR